MNVSDEIVAQARAWEKEAFGTLYDTFSRPVYDFLYYRTFDQSLAEDLTSETFLKAMRSIKQLRGSTVQDFKSWIFTIAHNTLIDSTRRDTATEDIVDHENYTSSEPDYAKQIDWADRLAQVLGYLDSLGPPHKDIILMAIWDDLKYSEIALITWLSLANIKKIISRTLPKIAANVTTVLPIFVLLTQSVQSY